MTPERLRAISLFAGLDEAQLEALAGAASEVEVEAGQTVALEGDFGHALFAIEEGRATVVQGDEVIRELGVGDVFGEIALLSSGRRTASVVSLTSMRLLTLFKRDVWRLEHEAPEVGEALRAAVAERLGTPASSES